MSATSSALVLWTPSFSPPGSGASSRSNSLGRSGSVSPWFAALMGAADNQAVSPLPSRPASSLSRPASSPLHDRNDPGAEGRDPENTAFSATSLPLDTHEDPNDATLTEPFTDPFNAMLDRGFTISPRYLAMGLPTSLSLPLRLPIECLQENAGPRIVELDSDVDMAEPSNEDVHTNSTRVDDIHSAPAAQMPPKSPRDDKIEGERRTMDPAMDLDQSPQAAWPGAPQTTRSAELPKASETASEKQVEPSWKEARLDMEGDKQLDAASSTPDPDSVSSIDSQEDWPLLKPTGRFVFPDRVENTPAETCISLPPEETSSESPAILATALHPLSPISLPVAVQGADQASNRASVQPSLETFISASPHSSGQPASQGSASSASVTQAVPQQTSSQLPQAPSTPSPQFPSAAASFPAVGPVSNTPNLQLSPDDIHDRDASSCPFEDSPSHPLEIKIKNTIPKRQVTLMRKSPSPEDHEQWRVGKTPGHQGSHARGKRRADGDEEKYDSARVLKRPFRPPTRIAAIAVKKTQPANIPIPSSFETGSDVPSSPPSETSISIPSTSSRLPSTRVTKPFLPLVRSGAPSPQSIKSSSQRASSFGKLRLKPIDRNAPIIAALETRLRILRQAVKYTAEGEDDRLASLVATWREAGREITDRLFALLPQPVESNSGTSCWDMGWGDSGSREREYERNSDVRGLIGDNHEDDILKILEQAGGGSPPGEWGVDLDTNRLSEEADDEIRQEAAWDRGAMLLRLGVDPDLLGFDKEMDDWKEIDDDEV